MIESETVSPARLKFKETENGKAEKEKAIDSVERMDTGIYYLKVPGISINDHYQVLDRYGAANERIYLMAVPYMAGLNPDFSGLDFCEAASVKIANSLLKKEVAI